MMRSPHAFPSFEIPLFEHFYLVILSVKGPIIAFAFGSTLTGTLDKTVVQAQVMTNGILPAFFGFQLTVIREFVADVIVDFG